VYRALAIGGERIVGVSPDRDGFDSDRASGTSLIDVPSLTILPAFFDNHNHLGEASRNNLFVGVGKAASISEMVELIRERAARTPAGEWIQTSNDWHQDRFVERRVPTAADLDVATNNHPVVARRGGHMAVVNSVALKMSGITRDTADPPGGHVGHTPSGDPDESSRAAHSTPCCEFRSQPSRSSSPNCKAGQRRSQVSVSAVCAIHW